MTCSLLAGLLLLQSGGQLATARKALHPCIESVDIVVMSNHASCILSHTAASLRRWYEPTPRRIFFVVPTAYVLECANRVGRKPTRTSCVDEKTLLNLSKGELMGALTAKGGEWANAKRQSELWQRLMWYYQQMLKLTLALSMPGLSEHFLVWDVDQILVQPYSACARGKFVLDYVTTHRTAAYDTSTQHLLGYRSPATKNWVTHKMYVVRSEVARMLARICGATEPRACALALLRRIPPSADVRKGISEYDLHAAWMLHELAGMVAPHATSMFRTNPMRKRKASEHCAALDALGTRAYMEQLGRETGPHGNQGGYANAKFFVLETISG